MLVVKEVKLVKLELDVSRHLMDGYRVSNWDLKTRRKKEWKASKKNVKRLTQKLNCKWRPKQRCRCLLGTEHCVRAHVGDVNSRNTIWFPLSLTDTKLIVAYVLANCHVLPYRLMRECYEKHTVALMGNHYTSFSSVYEKKSCVKEILYDYV